MRRISFCAADLADVLQEALSKKQVTDFAGVPHRLKSNVSEEEALAPYSMVRVLRPEQTLEIGLAHGVSALAILGALFANGSGHHYVIDPFQRKYGYSGEAMIARAGLGARHSFREQFPEEVIPRIPSLQFAFIDSSHLFDLTLTEFVLIDKKLDAGGIVAFHNLWMPSIQSVVRFILANRTYTICREFSGNDPTPSVGQRVKELGARCLRKIPGAARVLSANVLHPWSAFRIQNLLFLQKRSDDKRDWRFHRPF
jgi:predicted O-methyltransferase YrrM